MTIRRKLLASPAVKPQTIGVQRLIGRTGCSWYGFWARTSEPGGSRLSSARTFDWVLCKAAGITFDTIQHFNKRNPNPSVTPKWSDKPLLKSWEKTKPTLGFPRQTDSLCPACVKEAREAIIAGKKDWRDLMHEKVGEIKAQIIERDGQVWMVKDCPLHGHYEDMMAVDSKWLSWIERQYPGRDIPAHNDEDLHKHGSSTVRYGRGSVLTVDLTNRCNMMCDPCFMDANQVGYVHELSWDEIKEILDNALKIKPRRQMSVQFSGGEPTMSPYFFDAVAYARKIGSVVKFAMENPKKISFVSFQPVSFTGRDEDITPERRLRQRYTLSHLAKDVSSQVGKVEPTRDWFPISFVSTFAGFSDMVKGQESTWGSLSCGCHPNCGVGTALMINKETKEWAPVPRFLDAVQLTKDVTDITDAARGKNFSNFMMAMALLKNYHPFRGPKGLKLYDLFKKFDKTWALTKGAEKKYGKTSPDRTYEDAMKRRQTDPWNFLFIAGMWFQDLFNYDFRRTEMCIIPYATQQGEISFCAYNTGVGWRQIIENMHKNATVAEWYKTHGKHEIYAKGKTVNLQSFEHSLKIDAEDASRVRHLEHDIPVTAAEEDRARRKKAYEEQAKVRAIYEELVLKKPQPTVVQIGTVSDIAKAVPANFANAGKPVSIAPANGNGHPNGNGVATKTDEKAAEAVAGD